MGAIDPDIRKAELGVRLQRLMFLRVLVVSALLGASIFIEVRETQAYFGPLQTAHYLLIASIYFLTFIYVVLLKFRMHLLTLAYAQLLVDTLLVSAIIYTTGGMDSIFSFLYFLTIINGCMHLYRTGGMIIATASSLLYGGLVVLHYLGIIHPFGSRADDLIPFFGGYLYYVILVNTAAFYLVAFLASFLSEQVVKSRVELQAREDDILKLEALNERIVKNIASGLITLDGKGRILLFNPAAESILGIPGEEITGKRVGDVLPSLWEGLEKEKSSTPSDYHGTMPFIDLPFERPDGRRMFLRLSISSMRFTKSEEKGKIIVFQDMTKMRAIEREMKRVEGLALIGELAAGIAHEIRNPMASISGSIQMLKEGIKGENIDYRLMDIVLREINRLDRLVHDFLLFAKPQPANFADVDLRHLILESLELFKNNTKWTRGVRIHTRFEDGIQMRTDPDQMRQVLWNLYLNAFESLGGEGSLFIEAALVADERRGGSPPDTAKIVIRDTGAGFSPETLDHLFTPFYTTKEKGTGLGLAIVKRVVEGLKGRIQVGNSPEGGASIALFFPISTQ